MVRSFSIKEFFFFKKFHSYENVLKKYQAYTTLTSLATLFLKL